MMTLRSTLAMNGVFELYPWTVETYQVYVVPQQLYAALKTHSSQRKLARR